MLIAACQKLVHVFPFASLISLAFVAGAVARAQASGQSKTDHLLADRHYLRAESALRAEMQRTPNDAHVLSNLSIVDWAFNRLDASITDAEKAVAVAPNSAEAHSKLANALGAKLVSSNAGTFEKVSLARRFRKEIDRTLELDSNDADALQALAQFYWHAPGFVGGDKQKARQTADRLAALAPYRGAETRVDFASEEADTNKRNAAIRAIWQGVVATQQKSYEIRAALAAACLEDSSDAGHMAAAEAEAKRALALDPTRIEGYTVLAVVYARANRWNEVDTLLKQARERVPEDRTPQYRVAVTILKSSQAQQLERAEQMLRDYLNQPAEGQAPSHAGAHWRLGQVLELQGRKADAIRELQIAVQQDGSLDGAKKDLKRLS